MHILHYNTKNQNLEIISTFQIDLTLGGKDLTEISYITYDEVTKTIVVVFIQNYVLTANIEMRPLKKGHECKCEFHLEITNFTLTEIEAESALHIKRITV